MPVHLKDKQIFAENRRVVLPWEKDVGIRKDGKPDNDHMKFYRPEKEGAANATAMTPTIG